MKGGVGTHQEISVACEHKEAVREISAALCRYNGLKRVTLKWSESEGASRAVVLEDELNGAMAQATVAIVEDIFGFLRV